MKVGIICAVDRELEPFLAHIKDCRTTKKAMLTFYEGNINGVEAAAVYCGVAKTNAAVSAQILIDIFNVDIMINAGVAGGMNEELDVFDTVIVTESLYHDLHKDVLMNFHPRLKSEYFKSDVKLIDLSKEAVKRLPDEHKIFYGRVVSGEKFIDDEGRDEINAAFEPLSVDMETASIAHVCYVNEVPFIAVRSISDTAKDSGYETFEKNCDAAAVIAKDVVLELLNEIRNNYLLIK